MDNIKKWTILNSLMMNVERKSAKIDSYTDSRNNDKKAGYMKQRIYLTPVAHETFTEWKKNRKVKLEAEEDLLKRQLSKLNKDYDDDDYDHDILDLSGRRRTRRGTKTEQVLHEQSDEANKENIAENPYEGGNSNNTSK
ncbi:uncharacterized protein OCT59_028472 [Rhizophagus irregularis]|uniref:uncharacterized protein n=1 Tax=Rhizophagus irregularis TaxID=588596 RepID=UPI003319558C|nr:hypothetical protein OCT59_028472 [Rhizophagus irregularis]